MRRPSSSLRSSTSAGLLAAGLLLAGCGGGSTPAPTPTPNPTPTPTPSRPLVPGAFDHEGVDLVAWNATDYATNAASSSRQALASHGGNWAGLLVTWYMDTRNSSTIAPDAQRSPSDASLTTAIRHLHSLGFKVMLKPHVDVNDGTWRGSILPPDTSAWFESYDAYMDHMAHLAAAEGVEMFCVGTELARLSGATYRSQWQRVIANVRAVYTGSLTYAANATYGGDEFSSVAFVDLLDLAGLDGYVPLTAKDDPTIDELRAAWSRNRNGEDMLSAFRNWGSRYGKPVIFTEIGYRSMNGANRAPWDWSVTGSADNGEQADCYYAVFAVFLPERSWMRGVFWWAWDVSPPATGDTGYSPWTKPAGDVLRQQYSATQ